MDNSSQLGHPITAEQSLRIEGMMMNILIGVYIFLFIMFVFSCSRISVSKNRKKLQEMKSGNFFPFPMPQPPMSFNAVSLQNVPVMPDNPMLASMMMSNGPVSQGPPQVPPFPVPIIPQNGQMAPPNFQSPRQPSLTSSSLGGNFNHPMHNMQQANIHQSGFHPQQRNLEMSVLPRNTFPGVSPMMNGNMNFNNQHYNYNNMHQSNFGGHQYPMGSHQGNMNQSGHVGMNPQAHAMNYDGEGEYGNTPEAPNKGVVGEDTEAQIAQSVETEVERVEEGLDDN